MKKLENKVVVITGGNSGIGLATAKLFALNGAKVTITGRDPQKTASAAEEIGNGAIGITNDVAQLKNIDELYTQVLKTFGNIDILVINAGVNVPALLVDMTEAIFDEIVNVNFRGVFFSVQKVLPFLNDGATIVLTGSTASEKGFPAYAPYSATKAAIRSLARSFSAELLDRNIRVNVLSPGPVDTPIFDRGVSREEADATRSAILSSVPVKRLATAEEIAEGFLYLASSDSRYMLGSELLLDGGVRSL